MIYTCTLNPAIDLFIQTPQMKNKAVNRTDYAEILANGKGVNVSFILKMLAVDSVALGIGGGFTNEYIEKILTDRHIRHEFIHTMGTTRINVFTRVTDTNEEFKLVNPGPEVSAQEVSYFLSIIEKQLKKDDFLVISGSFSKGIAPTILTDIARLSVEQRFHLVVDSSYVEVMDILPYHPFLLKPNEEEIANWFGLDAISSVKELIYYGKKLIEKGAQNVLLSLGAEGAVFLNETTILVGNAPRGKVVNTACAGDTLLGTFLAGIFYQKEFAENLKKSIAAGSSTAFTAGLTDFSDVEALAQQITVHFYQELEVRQ